MGTGPLTERDFGKKTLARKSETAPLTEGDFDEKTRAKYPAFGDAGEGFESGGRAGAAKQKQNPAGQWPGGLAAAVWRSMAGGTSFSSVSVSIVPSGGVSMFSRLYAHS